MLKIMISAGEASGDLHGSRLVSELKAVRPDAEVFGIGGDRMQAAGMHLLYHINQMSIVGLSGIVRQLPFLRQAFKLIRNALVKNKPALIILIDYPGFNLRLAKIAQSLDIPVMYYIVPQVWAWGSWRLKKIARLVQQAVVILPFETEIFSNAGIKTEFVGHPLLDVLQVKSDKEAFFSKHQLSPAKKTIGLLPGSRVSEVAMLLPIMRAAVDQLREKHPDLQVVISKAESLDKQLFAEILEPGHPYRLIENATYEIMKYSDLLVVASGTATLEAGLFKTPMVIVYKVSKLTYSIGKLLVKVDFLGLVNLLAGRQIVPELVQQNCTARNLIQTVDSLLTDNQKLDRMREELSKIRQQMGQPGAAKRAAAIALNLIESARARS
ncbi:lipid-A-disaccharide synthase [candidate division KSB1 bacterium]|nr:lipid-A-disaccharide synthase [candidate division KSB1 bacterium]